VVTQETCAVMMRIWDLLVMIKSSILVNRAMLEQFFVQEKELLFSVLADTLVSTPTNILVAQIPCIKSDNQILVLMVALPLLRLLQRLLILLLRLQRILQHLLRRLHILLRLLRLLLILLLRHQRLAIVLHPMLAVWTFTWDPPATIHLNLTVLKAIKEQHFVDILMDMQPLVEPLVMIFKTINVATEIV